MVDRSLASVTLPLPRISTPRLDREGWGPGGGGSQVRIRSRVNPVSPHPDWVPRPSFETDGVRPQPLVGDSKRWGR